MQVAWQPWKRNITCKRLDHRRVKLIDEYPSGCSLMVGSLGWVVDPDILGSSPLGELPWITWYTILAGGIMYPFKKLFQKKKKKLIDEQYLIKGKELSPKQWHFTMSLLKALIDSYIMQHLFSAVNFSWLLVLIICKS